MENLKEKTSTFERNRPSSVCMYMFYTLPFTSNIRIYKIIRGIYKVIPSGAVDNQKAHINDPKLHSTEWIRKCLAFRPFRIVPNHWHRRLSVVALRLSLVNFWRMSLFWLYRWNAVSFLDWNGYAQPTAFIRELLFHVCVSYRVQIIVWLLLCHTTSWKLAHRI